MLSSKEVIYPYIVEELKYYYKNLPIDDLDFNLVRNFRRVGKK